MQVIGLPCHVIRNGRAASRLLAAKIPDIEAAFCRTGREGRRRSARHPLSLGEAARKAKVPGELVQIDTLFINIRPDEAIRPITACDPVTNGPPHVARYLKASGAKALLDKIVETAPFKISGIQADGGSEFKSVFEEEAKGAASNSSSCPSKARPQWLRRTRQSTWRYEFYAVYDLPHTIEKLQACADAFADHFNTQRPHEALAGLTPAEYPKSRSFDDSAKSHMY